MRSAIRSVDCRRSFMSPAPTAKGSTVAFMRAVLEAAGKRVHTYTSPNLVRINERYRIAGKLVEDDALAEALAPCERANGDAPITVFEIETAAGFLLFADNPADVTLLEVGLGGRLDATNVVERPLASVITPVSMDHVEFLGDTLEKIASEKAAIMKRGVPAVIGRQGEGPMCGDRAAGGRSPRAAACAGAGLDDWGGAGPSCLSGWRRAA